MCELSSSHYGTTIRSEDFSEHKQLTLGEVVSEQLAANIFDNQFPQKYYEKFLIFLLLQIAIPPWRGASLKMSFGYIQIMLYFILYSYFHIVWFIVQCSICLQPSACGTGFVGNSQLALLASTSGGEKSSDFFLSPVCSVYSSRDNLEFCEFWFLCQPSANTLAGAELGAQGQALWRKFLANGWEYDCQKWELKQNYSSEIRCELSMDWWNIGVWWICWGYAGQRSERK